MTHGGVPPDAAGLIEQVLSDDDLLAAPRSALAAAIEITGVPLLVVDRAGDVVASGQRCEDLLGLDPLGRTCCGVLRCRTDAASWIGCVTELVRDTGHSLGPMLLRRPSHGGSPAWLRAQPCADASGDVVVELDVVAEEERHGAADLSIQVLGSASVRRGGVALPREWLDQRPGLLLKYLVVRHGEEAPADQIAEALWPHLGGAGPDGVRHAVHLLRRQLQPDVPADAPDNVIVKHRGGYALDVSRVALDAQQFEAAIADGLTAYATDDADRAEVALMRALRLYRGDFLAEDAYLDWALDERERLRALLDAPLRLMVELRLKQRHLAGAARFAQDLAVLNPLDDDLHALLFGIWLRQGRNTRAARGYEIYARRLERELGERPSFTLIDLRGGRFSPYGLGWHGAKRAVK